MNIDLEQVKMLLEMVSKTEVAELTIEIEDERITIKKPHAHGGMPGPGHLPNPHPHPGELAVEMSHAGHPVHHAPLKGDHSQPAPKEAAKEENLVAITAPMVGTFYRASSPTAAPYLEVGDRVNIGQTVCIIEAMKLMNDLPSEIAGKVVKVCADNGTTVEYGQQLFLIDPKG